MKRLIFPLFLLVVCSITQAQNKKKQDQKAIKDMCGCYEVSFNFAETFEYSNNENYQPSKVKHDKGLEWVQLVEDHKNKIVLQHLLIVGSQARQRVIKHWRQDWLYENTDLYTYNMNNEWTFHSLAKKQVKGQWTQKVFQVDDSPRYEGSAAWIHTDGKSSWENTANAPLPRREYTKRDDYNVTVRTNKHIITQEGWVHDQDNDKVIRKKGQKDILLAQEKGYNIYTKVDNNRCKAAQNWWKEHQDNWAKVRIQWDKIFAQKKDLQLETSVNGKPLFSHLFDKEFKFTEEKVEETIDSFVVKK